MLVETCRFIVASGLRFSPRSTLVLTFLLLSPLLVLFFFLLCQGDWMSDDFEFVGPEGGVLSKAEYLDAISTVDLSTVFTDLKSW